MRPEFKAFPKIPRARRPWIVTEKIDGSNAQVRITEEGEIFAGSRNRWITPEDDNYGFAAWVESNKTALLGLGVGHHYGEWWGQGIQRRYSLTEKRFHLFNSGRWSDPEVRPACCGVVPVLAVHNDSSVAIETALKILREGGSVVAPGFMVRRKFQFRGLI